MPEQLDRREVGMPDLPSPSTSLKQLIIPEKLLDLLICVLVNCHHERGSQNGQNSYAYLAAEAGQPNSDRSHSALPYGVGYAAPARRKQLVAERQAQQIQYLKYEGGAFKHQNGRGEAAQRGVP